ncbi:complement component 1, q subcomponent-like 4 like [Brachyhypopomus gauderio]|uniref:complement component 1, q subcomponent-like 4 like n=1 Tax=Brachyhypopomus gauderio TaxID=698409 RepID=UPI00404310B2
MLKTVIVPQLALLLCAWSTKTQDFMSPSVNIIAELGKVKDIEEQLKIMKQMLQNQNNLVAQLNSRVVELEIKNEALQIMAQTSLDKTESMQKENEARKVAFSASLLDSETGHNGPVLETSPLIYKRVFTNFGNGYDSSTGIFTAPLKGVYYFRFYAHSHTGIRMAVSLYKNDVRQCSLFSLKPTNTNGNASNGIVLTLQKGDQIFTKLWENTWVYDDPNSYTSFGGFLLFPL